MPDIIIAGAGPTGLVLACSLARQGIAFRLVDRAPGPGTQSRAMAVHARTLEFYRQLGFAQPVVDAGVRIEHVHLRESDGKPGHERRNHEVLSLALGDMGGELSPYPFVLAYPQDDHERFLVARLQELGVAIEWNTEVTGFTQDDEGVSVTLSHKGEAEVARAAYVCGCDGAHSAVRQTLDMDFPGGTYDQPFFVADVRVKGGFRRDMFMSLGENMLALMLPVRSSGMQRLIGLVPHGLAGHDDPGWQDVRASIEPLLDVEVEELNWFSIYRVHHRVARHFRAGRAFLLGDAAHVHSPVAGQGMNTGIGDAINLAWKLAMVTQGQAHDALLDSYEAERIGFARKLVATTDRVFTPMIAQGLGGQLVRRGAAPLFTNLLTRFSAGRHAAFRLLSQIGLHYGHSPLSTGRAGRIAGGDRLPWLAAEDNFAPLSTLDWQVHVYGEIDETFAEACRALGLDVHGFAWSAAAQRAGLARDAAYLIRPDGYVGLAQATPDAMAVSAYMRRLTA